MKKIVVYVVFIFIIADALALVVWWTHPQGARKMGYSGEIPFALPFELPWKVVVKGSADRAPAEPLPESVTTPPEQFAVPTSAQRRRAAEKRKPAAEAQEPEEEQSEDASKLLSNPFANYE